MPKCLLALCSNATGSKNKDQHVMLHIFPRQPDRIREWLLKTGQRFKDIEKLIVALSNDERRKNYRLCSTHFTEDCYVVNGNQKTLRKDAVPTIFPRSTGVPCIDEYMFFRPPKRPRKPDPATPPSASKDSSTSTETGIAVREKSPVLIRSFSQGPFTARCGAGFSMMNQDGHFLSEALLNITLEIIFLLIGEDYILVKKTGDNATDHSNTLEEAQSAPRTIMDPPPNSLVHVKNNGEKIRNLAGKIINLLSEEEFRFEEAPLSFSQ
ncbi:uncharacterized protein LOC128469302 [Spea bombifrons]|uniref:uncharacterized protein LOC128469302 n=1 Tax=Spea bombifrons TaxID=233779 RepID=UPI00234BE7DD|nr:uncharacterized protein LOC128469302 [Spea bombifrons]